MRSKLKQLEEKISLASLLFCSLPLVTPINRTIFYQATFIRQEERKQKQPSPWHSGKPFSLAKRSRPGCGAAAT
jgi:hypothetical protein